MESSSLILTREQIQGLLALLPSPASRSNTQVSVLFPNHNIYNNYVSSVWILDSRATDHYVTLIQCFDAYKYIKLIFPKLRNRKFCTASISGSFKLIIHYSSPCSIYSLF